MGRVARACVRLDGFVALLRTGPRCWLLTVYAKKDANRDLRGQSVCVQLCVALPLEVVRQLTINLFPIWRTWFESMSGSPIVQRFGLSRSHG